MSWKLRDGNGYFNNDLGSVSIRLGDKKPLLELSGAGPKTDHPLFAKFDPVDRMGPNALPESNHLELGEAYVRQDDLIASFPELSPCRFGYQIDLRIIKDPECLGVETWLSVQTSFLDSYPQIFVDLGSGSHVGAGFDLIANGVWVTARNRYALMIHPYDLIDSKVELNASKLTMQLFGRFMEKGVIRRMRFRLFVGPAGSSSAFWIERMQEFSQSPLPLTT